MGDGDIVDGMVYLLICFLLYELWEGVRLGFLEGKIICFFVVVEKRCFLMIFWFVGGSILVSLLFFFVN